MNVCQDYVLARWDTGGGYDGVTRVDVRADFYDLTAYLIQEYRGQNKTFLLSIFFEMNLYMGSLLSGRVDFPVLEFVSDAQAGIRQALEDQGHPEGIDIYDCVEVSCAPGWKSYVETYFTSIQADLYGITYYCLSPLSSYLDFIAQKVPDSPSFGEKNVIVGEYGIKMEDFRVAGSEERQRDHLRGVMAAAEEWGCPYAFQFWLADQESKVEAEGHFGLKDLDGHQRLSWDYYHGLYGGGNR